ncbi:MAG: cyclic nucleotide-binding domain-containing protein [Bermanella sp.]
MIRSPFWQNLFRPAHKHSKHICDLWLATPIFAQVSHGQCLQLVNDMAMRHYQGGEAIFRLGDVGIGTGLIISGSVNIRVGDKTLANMVEGDFFGEVALVIEAPRTATAVAEGDTQIVFFLRPQLEALLSRAPRQGAKIMQNLARVMANRLGFTNTLLEKSHVDD